MGRATLFGLVYSPWTERARWALDHHRIRYRYREHVPLLGEGLLRWAARGSGEKQASVPLLRDGHEVLGDSFRIILHADRVGQGAKLVPDASVIETWLASIEPALHAVRKRVTRRTLADPEALKEAAAGAMPTVVAGFFRPVAAMGARFIARKYGFDASEQEQDSPLVSAVLDEVRAQLDGGAYLGEAFSAADILAATFLQSVKPVADSIIRLGPATRRAWSRPELAEEYDDLIAWRDQLYATHRHP